MIWHHRMCKFAHHPHPNILPAMPRPRTEKSAVTEIVKEREKGGATLWKEKEKEKRKGKKEGKREGRSSPVIKSQMNVFSSVAKTRLGKIQIWFYKLSHLVSGGKICNIRFNHWQRLESNYQPGEGGGLHVKILQCFFYQPEAFQFLNPIKLIITQS